MTYEQQYICNLRSILLYGTKEKNKRTGIETRRLPATQIVVDLNEEFPILLSKKVNWKAAIDEILWIMQKQSNKIAELNSKIWNQWARPDGTIGKSYGYQVSQQVKKDDLIYPDQVSYVLQTLKRDNSSRQCVIDLWNISDLDDMSLVPCVYSSIWNIIDGRLNCMVVQRSADYPVGVPFDTLEYAALTHLFARHLGIRPGLLTHVMADSHIYENQVEGVKKQLEQYKAMETIAPQHPKLIFKEDTPKNFWQIKLEDMTIDDYAPMPAIKYEVAV